MLQFLKKFVNCLLEEIEPPKPDGIIYEHEMVLQSQENIVSRAIGIVVIIAFASLTVIGIIGIFNFFEIVLALFLGAFYYVLIKHYRLGFGNFLLVMAALTILTLFISPTPRTHGVVFMPLFGIKVLLMLPECFNDRNKIRLIITHTSLLIRAPKWYAFGRGGELNFIHLEFPLHSISDVSIKDISHPDLKSLLNEYDNFRNGLTNKELSWITRKIYPSLLYQYIFVLPRGSLHNLQFIDLEPRNEWRILIEFDDVQNFLRVLKQRMAEVEIENAQNEKEIREMMEQWRNGTWKNNTWNNNTWE